MKMCRGKSIVLIGTFVFLLTFVAYRYIKHLYDMNYVRTECPGRIIYPDGDSLMELRLATGERRKILELSSPNKGASATVRKHYSLSLDGNILAYDEIGDRSDSKIPHTLRIIDRVRNKQILKRVLGDSHVLGTALSHKGDKIAVAMQRYPAGSEGSPRTDLVVWDVSTGATLLEEKDPSVGVSWFPNGRKIVYGGKWDKLVIFDFSTKEHRRAGWKKLPNFSPDGKWIMFGEDVVYNCESKRTDKLLINYRSLSVHDWSPDSKHFLYTVSDDISLPDAYIYDVISKKSYRLPIDGSNLMEYPMQWVK